MTIYECDKCEKKFTSNSGRWYHRKKCGKITSCNTHKCTKCSYTTSGPKCTLKNHMNSKHTEEKDRPYQCRSCERGFAQKSHLNKHIVKVHGLKAIKVCDRNIIEYHIKVLKLIPTSQKTKNRIKLYKQNPIIKKDMLNNLKFWFTKTLKASHLHYDVKKGYISFIGKTIDDLTINNKNKN